MCFYIQKMGIEWHWSTLKLSTSQGGQLITTISQLYCQLNAHLLKKDQRHPFASFLVLIWSWTFACLSERVGLNHYWTWKYSHHLTICLITTDLFLTSDHNITIRWVFPHFTCFIVYRIPSAVGTSWAAEIILNHTYAVTCMQCIILILFCLLHGWSWG